MGIYDRDYYRGDSDRMFASLGRWSATVWIIVITCGIFLLQLVTRDTAPPGITEWGIYSYQGILDGEVWRFLTAMFLHDTDNIFHVAFNMLVLYWFGRVMEERYGSREFTLFYLASGVLANIGYFLIQTVTPPPHFSALGASGGVTAVMVLFAMNYPKQQVLLFFVIPMPIWALVEIFVGLDALGALGIRQGRIAFVVHLLGALFGFLYFTSGVRLSALIPGRSPSRSAPARPRLRVLPMEPNESTRDEPGDIEEPVPTAPTEEALESKLDRVLEKVSQYGQESLSREEREILFRASEVYKKRRK